MIGALIKFHKQIYVDYWFDLVDFRKLNPSFIYLFLSFYEKFIYFQLKDDCFTILR